MSELKVHRFITTDELFSEANAGALYYDKSEADKVIAEQKAKADKLHSCLKCLVMRDLIKDCPEKKSAIDLMEKLK